MKQRKVLLVFMLGAMVLGTTWGCGKEKDDIEKQEKVVEESSKENSEESEEPLEKEEGNLQEESEKISQNTEEQQDKEKAFTITKEVYEEGDIHIEYPHVENLVNQEITDWYNEKFKSVIDVYNGDVEEGDIAAVSEYVNETFQVTYQSEDMISILIEGNFYAEGAAHPYSYMNSYNINLKTGETMGITDEYSPEEIVDDIFSGQNYTVINDVDTLEEADAEVAEYVKQEFLAGNRDFMLEYMQGCDYDFKVGADGKIIEGEDIVYEHSIRLKDGTWALGMEVTHVLGDYIIIRYDK